MGLVPYRSGRGMEEVLPGMIYYKGVAVIRCGNGIFGMK